MSPSSAETELAHRVLNLVLVKVRWLIGENTDSKILYDILDRIEILPTMMSDSGQLRTFFDHVEALSRAPPAFQTAVEEMHRGSALPVAG